MGRQVNFYMLPEDLAGFELMLRTKGGISFVSDLFSSPSVQTITTLQGSTQGKRYLALDIDLGSIVTRLVSKQNLWRIDDLRSPVIEFTRGYFDGNSLRRGRLYFSPGFYDDSGHWVEKHNDFVKWADGLLHWIRKNYKRDSNTGYYIGPHVLKKVSSGGIRLVAL